MPRTLHLIKHGKPQFVAGVPAHEWPLAPDALTELPALAARLDPRPDVIVCSLEPKAHATAQALADHLSIPLRPMHGLHEQLRYTARCHADPADFQAEYRAFFAQPDRLVVGEETARAAHTRFSNAVNAVMAANPQPTVAVVAHGTVISLLVAALRGVEPYPLWQDLPLLGVLSVPWEPGPVGARTAP